MTETIQKLREEIHKVVIGQERLVNGLIIGLISNGHILVEGVPGLAKTTTINTLAKTLGLNFKRTQFTPDLLPTDIIGAEIYDPKNSEFKLKKGPIFTNLLLADEINRAPAKVQSALLEVMQERQVTIGDETFKLDPPFLVLATQNPLEQEGVYPLPEAQLDRFMLKIVVGYNTPEEELEILNRFSTSQKIEVSQVLNREDIFKIREEVENIHVDDEVKKYIVHLIFATRYPEKYGLKELEPLIHSGASPRATIDLIKVSKAMAYLNGRDYLSPVDIAQMVYEVLRHRIILTYEAEADNITSDDVIRKVVEKVEIP
ncbi:MAG TPA: MoxR family ATPase [Campylobacterales bacterium]|nr:MoxR family ATPase [Campylobacterales bacterium]HIO70905.1 MoxR family ATPase [Campylobacterales bacterium]